MRWQPIAEYPHKEWSFGPDVLLTWRRGRERRYGVGCSFSSPYCDGPEDGPQLHSFMVNEWTVEPDYFAYPTDPENPPNRRHP